MTLTSRLKVLLIAPGATSVFFPLWQFVIVPRIFPEIACVIVQQPSGEPVKAWGQPCLDAGSSAIVLRVQ